MFSNHFGFMRFVIAALIAAGFAGCAAHEFQPGSNHPANPAVISPISPRADIFNQSLWTDDELNAAPAMHHEGHGPADLGVGIDPVISSLVNRPLGEGSGAEPLARSDQPPDEARAQVRDANAVPPEQKLRGETPPAGAGIIYTCPMHPEIRKPTPGKCPICHMDLVPEVHEAQREFTAEKYAHTGH